MLIEPIYESLSQKRKNDRERMEKRGRGMADAVAPISGRKEQAVDRETQAANNLCIFQE